ncbi:putative ATP-dependent RNA helicase DDX31 [Huso huso]|uniref:ATP-dependent RNA helicase n=1 Tax=Huso huso TaxID=61971 RepID=A0ABR0YE45_HUSHU
MAEDGLMLNISDNYVLHKGNKMFKKSFKLADKWKVRKAAKRAAEGGDLEGPPSKQKLGSPAKRVPQTAEKATLEKGTPKSLPKIHPKKQVKEGGRTPETAPKGKGTPRSHSQTHTAGWEDREGGERPFIKTSSLFRNNPEIPEIHRPAVAQLKEKVFTSDSFSELDLHPHLLSTLNNVLKVSSMTSVQKQTIPALLDGRDAVVRSQTGSGKTLAYGIPLVQSLQAVQPKIQRSDGPLAVIVVPTRELALQSFNIIQKLLKPFTWIVPGVLMGGEKRKSEKARLRKGINILITTPGRLVDHINNTKSISFSCVGWLILDEADRILDLGFEKDVAVILNALNAAREQRQNVLLSATMTEGVSKLAGICMKEPVSIQVAEAPAEPRGGGGASLGAPSGGLSESFAVPEKLRQHAVVVPSKLRLVTLAAFLLGKCKHEKGQKVIVFLSSCESVEFLFAIFKEVLCNNAENQKSGAVSPQRPLLDFMRLHGNMEQEERTEVFQKFSQVNSGILLCTDVAARGLDLPQVTWIVQYTAPASPAEYVHRVGRTARIGTQGSSLLFLTPTETDYLGVLGSHNISMSEMKMEDILASLMLEDEVKGRGQWGNKKSHGAVQQEVRERATVLQTEFENFVHSCEENVQAAKKALQSFVRGYATYPASLKHIFHIKTLHLGHVAKSFGLRDAPQNLSASLGKARHSKAKEQKKRPVKKMSNKERMAEILRSEYSSGIESAAPNKQKQKTGLKMHRKPGQRKVRKQQA